MKNSIIKKIPCIIPTTIKDYLRIRPDYNRLFELLPVSKVVFIGAEELKEKVAEDSGHYPDLKIEFLNENSLISRITVFKAIRDKDKEPGPEPKESIRPGWYYQQFLKMAYHTVCEDDYYMSWDIDTIPLRKIDMFNDAGKPFFDLKQEYNPGYFKVIKRLFGFEKVISKSFVAEHMLFSKELMAGMIEEIDNAAIEGSEFYEKIINAIDPDYISLGFSEFETYGSWVAVRHPEAYTLRDWVSLRRGRYFLNCNDLTEDDIEWLSRDFDAVTFESNNIIPEMAELFRNPKYRQNMSAGQFYRTIFESGYFGAYSEKGIDSGGWFAPI